MIKYISINNYGSILDATLHFTFEESKAPRGYHDFQTIPFIEIGKNRLVPSLALIPKLSSPNFHPEGLTSS